MASAAAASERSLWAVMQQCIPPQEKDEFARLIGTRLIEENENLWRELHALEEIWDQTQQLGPEQDQEEPGASGTFASKPELLGGVERDLLEQQISMLVDKVLPLHRVGLSEKDSEVLGYVLSARGERGGRGSSSSSRAERGDTPPSRSSDNRPESRPSTRSSRSLDSSLAVVEAVQDKLNLAGIPEILDSLRTAFENEKEQLLDEVQTVTVAIDHAIDDAAAPCGPSGDDDHNIGAGAPKPTVTELRDVQEKLEEVWLHGSREPSPISHRGRTHVLPNGGMSATGGLPGADLRTGSSLSPTPSPSPPRSTSKLAKRRILEPRTLEPASSGVLAAHKPQQQQQQPPQQQQSEPQAGDGDAEKPRRRRNRIRERLNEAAEAKFWNDDDDDDFLGPS